MSLALPITREERAMKLVWDKLYRPRMRNLELREALIDLANFTAWDDAVHIGAPWEPRSSLCGNWNRNLVALTDPRPDGISGCWTCLIAAEWCDGNVASSKLATAELNTAKDQLPASDKTPRGLPTRVAGRGAVASKEESEPRDA